MKKTIMMLLALAFIILILTLAKDGRIYFTSEKSCVQSFELIGSALSDGDFAKMSDAYYCAVYNDENAVKVGEFYQ